MRPVRANDYVGMILTRAVQSSAKHRIVTVVVLCFFNFAISIDREFRAFFARQDLNIRPSIPKSGRLSSLTLLQERDNNLSSRGNQSKFQKHILGADRKETLLTLSVPIKPAAVLF